jgi:hypothetical protein
MERTMKAHAPGAWISLNASYYFPPLCHPASLLDDADLLLGSAHGIAQSLSDLLGQSDDVNPGHLAEALWAVALLVKMGQSSAQEAQRRMQKMRRDGSGADEAEVTEA